LMKWRRKESYRSIAKEKIINRPLPPFSCVCKWRQKRSVANPCNTPTACSKVVAFSCLGLLLGGAPKEKLKIRSLELGM
ncbi:MAG: hypothetical protein WCL14_13255, partial [Bacteroidota bacterium]